MKHTILLIICALLPLSRMGAQTFSDHFADSTLRLDYVLAGDNRAQHIFFRKAICTPRWAGRKSRLGELLLRGNGKVEVRDQASGLLVYANSFSTLFQEWQATEEATRLQKAFEVSLLVPMPLRRAEVSVSLTDFHGRVVGRLAHTVDPGDILIERLSPGDVPYHYVWKGHPGTPAANSGGDDGGKQADSAGKRNFRPTLLPPDDGADITHCIDLAIVAEGYTRREMGKFYADCRRVADALFAHEPFKSLKNRFNIVAVASESAESGPSVPHLGLWRRTPTDTHYDTFYTQRYLMSQDIHRIHDLLLGIPYEHVVVLVNSDTYGGGGIFNHLTVATSDHPTFSQVFVHEFGHAYGGLGDEYFYDDAYESMYPSDTEPWEPNLTTLADFSAKWADMVPKGTPVPTPPAALPDYRNIKSDKERRLLNEATQRVGVFEGGGYQSKGVFRPAQECRMKINEVEDFCPVCTRAIIRLTDFYTTGE